MELIESESKSEQGALPEPEPRYQTASLPVEKSEHGQTWVRLAAATVLAVILVILIVLLARWIYHKAHNHSGPSTSTSQNTPAASVNNPPAASRPSSPDNSSSSSGSSKSSSGQITNTGPGDVAAIFIGASLAAGGLHYLISVRRFAKNS